MFEWSDIRIMLAVARAGSTLGAAKCLGMNQTTVSRRIQSLEHALGLTLFERDTRGYAPTSNGRALLALSESMQCNAERIGSLATSLARGADGRIRISAATDTQAYWVSKVTAAYREEHPGIIFDIDDSPHQVDLIAGEADIALRATDRIDDESLIARKLGSAIWATFCSKRYVRNFGLPRSMEELAERKVFFYSDSLVEKVALLRYFGDRLKPDQILQTFSSTSSLANTLEFSDAVGLLPVVSGDSRPELVQCFTDDGFRQTVWIVTSPDGHNRPMVRDFMRFFGNFGLKDGFTLV